MSQRARNSCRHGTKSFFPLIISTQRPLPYARCSPPPVIIDKPFSGETGSRDSLDDAEANAWLKAFAKRLSGEPEEQSSIHAQDLSGRDAWLGSAFHLSTGSDEAGAPTFAARGRFATGGFEADTDGST